MEYVLEKCVSGKLHMNIQESDVLIHCTDNPGRVTILRTSIMQKQRTKPEMTADESFDACIQELVSACKVETRRDNQF